MNVIIIRVSPSIHNMGGTAQHKVGEMIQVTVICDYSREVYTPYYSPHVILCDGFIIFACYSTAGTTLENLKGTTLV